MEFESPSRKRKAPDAGSSSSSSSNDAAAANSSSSSSSSNAGGRSNFDGPFKRSSAQPLAQPLLSQKYDIKQRSHARCKRGFDAGVELDEVTGNMTVEQFLKDLLAKMIDKAQARTTTGVQATTS